MTTGKFAGPVHFDTSPQGQRGKMLRGELRTTLGLRPLI